MTIQQVLLSNGSLNWIMGGLVDPAVGTGGAVVDPTNSLYVLGPLPTNDTSFVVKCNPLGQAEWVSTALGQTGSGESFSGKALVRDTSGNLYALGDYISAGGTRSFYVAKYNSAGALQWANTYTASSFAITGLGAEALNIDSAGNMFVVGRITPSGQVARGFAVKLNSSGVVQWQRSYVGSGSTGITNFLDCALDSAGNLYAVGWSRDFAGSTPIRYDGVLIKWDTSGTLLWQRRSRGTYVSGSALSQLDRICVDAADNIYCTGRLSGGTTLTYVAMRYNTSGVLQDIKNIGDFAASLTFDISGNLYMSYSNGLIYVSPSFGFLWGASFQINATPGTVSSLSTIASGVSNNVYFVANSGDYGVFLNGFFANIPNTGTKTGTYTVGTDSVAYDPLTVSITSFSSYTEEAASLVAPTPALTFSSTAYTTTSTFGLPTTTVKYI